MNVAHSHFDENNLRLGSTSLRNAQSQEENETGLDSRNRVMHVACPFINVFRACRNLLLLLSTILVSWGPIVHPCDGRTSADNSRLCLLRPSQNGFGCHICNPLPLYSRTNNLQAFEISLSFENSHKSKKATFLMRENLHTTLFCHAVFFFLC